MSETQDDVASSHARPNDVAGAAPLSQPEDWRAVAEQRLSRLVEIEHDHSIMCDRLAMLQVDYLEVIVASDERLKRISELDRARTDLQRQLRELENEHHRAHVAYREMRESFEQSRSWRLTRPIRWLSMLVRGNYSKGDIVRRMLRVPLLRRGARFAVRMLPGLRERIRSRLYGSRH